MKGGKIKIKTMENLMKKLKIGAVCLAIGIGGFGLGKATSKVDYISFHQDQFHGLSGYKAVRLHKPLAQDDVFVRRNGYFYWEAEDSDGKYTPVRKNIENRHGQKTEFAERRINDVYQMVGLE